MTKRTHDSAKPHERQENRRARRQRKARERAAELEALTSEERNELRAKAGSVKL